MKKLFICGLIASMLMGSSLSVFAGELPGNTDKPQIKAERLAKKEAKKAEKEALKQEKLTERAEKQAENIEE